MGDQASTHSTSQPSSSTPAPIPPNQPTVEQVLSQLLAQQQWMQQEIVALHQQQQQQPQQPSVIVQPNSGLAASFSSALKPAKPSTFTGDRKRNAQAWLWEMETYFEAVGLTDPRRVLLAASQLRDDAVIWWKSISSSTPIRTWCEFKSAFLAQYQPVEGAETARMALDTLKQREQVSTYCNQFLAHRNHIPDMTVAEELFLFKKGLQEHIKTEVRMRQPKTLQQAMTVAMQADIETRGQRKQAWQPRSNGFGAWSRYPQQRMNAYPAQAAQQAVPMELGQVQAAESMSGEVPMEADEWEYDLAAVQQQQSLRGAWRPVTGGLSRSEYERCREARVCFQCKQPGHIQRNCTRRGPVSGSKAPKNSQSQQ